MVEISFQEWKFIGLIWLIVTVLILIPTIIGVIFTPPDSVLWNLKGINGSDIGIYYTQIEAVKNGQYLFKHWQTSEPHHNFVFDPFWLAVGIMAKIFNLSPLIVFNLTIFILTPFLLIASYYFVALFFQDKLKRKICFILLVFASGLGVYVLGVLREIPRFSNVNSLDSFVDSLGRPILPIDIFMPEAFTFLSIYVSPHLIASLILIILIFFFSFLAFETKKIKYSFLSGLSTLFLFQFHPYHVLTIFGVLGVFLIVSFLKEKKLSFYDLRHYFILIFFSLPPIFYYYWTTTNIMVRQQQFSQALTLTPSLIMVLSGYGFLIPLAIIGSFQILKKGNLTKREIFLLTWSTTQFLLLYFPVPFQRRMATGLQIVLVILATYGLFVLKNWLEQKIFFQKTSQKANYHPFFYFFLLYLFFSFFCLTNFLILINDIMTYFQGSDRGYLKKDIKEAMSWLKDNTEEESIIFSSQINGLKIPAYSLRQVFLGHPHQTVQFSQKWEAAQKFFESDNDKERFLFLKENKINYFFFGPEEKNLILFNPEEKDYLKKVFKNKEVTIYKINYF